ncbi:MAG: hypothetical protein HS130_09620 [Deltaproteobacteria bacterium]|nr:hypothetical protein [Deltaproteobacteria bacterium]
MLLAPELANSFPGLSITGPLPIAALFFFISIAGLAFLSREERERAIFPGMAAALSLFLAKGTKAPFDSIGEVIFFAPVYDKAFQEPRVFLSWQPSLPFFASSG